MEINKKEMQSLIFNLNHKKEKAAIPAAQRSNYPGITWMAELTSLFSNPSIAIRVPR